MRLLKRFTLALLLLGAFMAFGSAGVPDATDSSFPQLLQSEECIAYQGSSSTVGNPSPYRKKDVVNKYHGTLKSPESGVFDNEPLG